LAEYKYSASIRFIKGKLNGTIESSENLSLIFLRYPNDDLDPLYIFILHMPQQTTLQINSQGDIKEERQYRTQFFVFNFILYTLV